MPTYYRKPTFIERCTASYYYLLYWIKGPFWSRCSVILLIGIGIFMMSLSPMFAVCASFPLSWAVYRVMWFVDEGDWKISIPSIPEKITPVMTLVGFVFAIVAYIFDSHFAGVIGGIGLLPLMTFIILYTDVMFNPNIY